MRVQTFWFNSTLDGVAGLLWCPMMLWKFMLEVAGTLVKLELGSNSFGVEIGGSSVMMTRIFQDYFLPGSRV